MGTFLLGLVVGGNLAWVFMSLRRDSYWREFNAPAVAGATHHRKAASQPTDGGRVSWTRHQPPPECAANGSGARLRWPNAAALAGRPRIPATAIAGRCGGMRRSAWTRAKPSAATATVAPPHPSRRSSLSPTGGALSAKASCGAATSPAPRAAPSPRPHLNHDARPAANRKNPFTHCQA
jgi:hypothetical protein